MSSITEDKLFTLLSSVGSTLVLQVILRPMGSQEEFPIIVRESTNDVQSMLHSAINDGFLTNNGMPHELLKINLAYVPGEMKLPIVIQEYEIPRHQPRMSTAIERDQQYQEAVQEAVALVKHLCGPLDTKIHQDVKDRDEVIRVALFKFLKNEDPRNSLEIEIFHKVGPYRTLLSRLI